MPKKSKFLVDLLTNTTHEIPANGFQFTIGRGKDCDFQTLSPTDSSKKYDDKTRNIARSVSRVQAKVIHTVDGRVLLMPLYQDNHSPSPMYIGTEKEPLLSRIYSSEEILLGTYITIGNGYQFVLREFREQEPIILNELYGRTSDTGIIRVSN